jgi:hypothetical protein
MGAQAYDNLIVIKGTPQDAFNEACEEANDYNGHQEGYSGDIQTAHGFRMRKDNPRYGTKSFETWEEKLTDDMDKGDCVCVELEGAVLKRLKERRGYKGKKGIRAFYFFGMGRC